MLKIIVFICTLVALHTATKQSKAKGRDVTKNKIGLFSAVFFTKS